MTMTGDNTRAIFKRYSILNEGDLPDAAHKLDDFVRSPTDTGTVTIPAESRRGALVRRP